MKTLLLAFLLLPASVFAQGIARYDLPILPTTPSTAPIGSLPQVLAVTNATVSVCSYPATIVSGMCTNTITTYTDSTGATACPSTAQLTAPGTSVCTSTTGLQGALGFWYNGSAAHLTYTVKTPWGAFGPYDIAPSIGAAGNPSAPAYCIQFANSGASAFACDSLLTYNPTLHTITTQNGLCLTYGKWNVRCSGATGNGTTDDTANFQAGIDYANTNALDLYVPAGTYLITKSLDLCGLVGNPTAVCSVRVSNRGLRITGDSSSTSIIKAVLTEAYPVLDTAGSVYGWIEHIGMIDAAGNQATAGIYANDGGAPSPQGQQYGVKDDITISLTHSGTTTPGVVFATDQDYIGRFVNVTTLGSALILGNTLGTQTSLVSKFSTVVNDGGCTHMSIGSDSNFTSYNDSAIQFTSCADFDGGDNDYATTDGTGTNVLDFQGPEDTAVNIHGIRTEYHGSAGSAACALYISGAITGGFFGGVLTTSSTGTVICGSGAIIGTTLKVDDGGEGQLFNFSGPLQYDDLEVGFASQTPTPVMGTLSYAVPWDLRIRTGEVITQANMLAGFTGGVYGNVQLCGSDGCSWNGNILPFKINGLFTETGTSTFGGVAAPGNSSNFDQYGELTEVGNCGTLFSANVNAGITLGCLTNITNLTVTGTCTGCGGASQSVTIAPGSGTGSGATAVCKTGATCNTHGGEVTLTLGTTPSSNEVTVTTTPALPAQFNCTVNETGPAIAVAGPTGASTTVMTIGDAAVLTSGVVTYTYVCNQ
jgi:hypothetical protein